MFLFQAHEALVPFSPSRGEVMVRERIKIIVIFNYSVNISQSPRRLH